MTDILTKLAALHEHPKTVDLREHIRRGYGFRAIGAERVWSLHDDEIRVLNTGFTCLDDRCKSLIALVQEAAGEIERLSKRRANEHLIPDEQMVKGAREFKDALKHRDAHVERK